MDNILDKNEQVVKEHVEKNNDLGMEQKAVLMNTLLMYSDGDTDMVEEPEQFIQNMVENIEEERARNRIPDSVCRRIGDALCTFYVDKQGEIPSSLRTWLERDLDGQEQSDCNPFECVVCRAVLKIVALKPGLEPAEVADELDVEVHRIAGHVNRMRDRDWITEYLASRPEDDDGGLDIYAPAILEDHRRNLLYYANESDSESRTELVVLLSRFLQGGIGGLDFEDDTPVPRHSEHDISQTATVNEVVDKMWASLLTIKELQRQKDGIEASVYGRDKTIEDAVEWVIDRT